MSPIAVPPVKFARANEVSLAYHDPHRVDGVVLLMSGARVYGDMADGEAEHRRTRMYLLDRWGTDASISLDVRAPSLAADPDYREWHTRYERHSASPTAVRELFAMLCDIDIRPLLPLVEAPRLVIHRRNDPSSHSPSPRRWWPACATLVSSSSRGMTTSPMPVTSTRGSMRSKAFVTGEVAAPRASVAPAARRATLTTADSSPSSMVPRCGWRRGDLDGRASFASALRSRRHRRRRSLPRPVLSEDADDDWAGLARDRLTMTVIGAHRRLDWRASSDGRHDAIVEATGDDEYKVTGDLTIKVSPSRSRSTSNTRAPLLTCTATPASDSKGRRR